MTQAIEYLYEFYSGFVNFVFEEMEIVQGVTFGWVCITIIIFGILVKNILAVPRSGKSITMKFKKGEDNE